MISVLNLDREERIKDIVTNILLKDSINSTYSMQYTKLDESHLNLIIESIEDRIYYITESPSFEFNGSNYTTSTYNSSSISDFKKLMNNNPDDFFIIYSIQVSPGVITQPYVPSVSKTQSYHLRGCFIKDPSIKRNKIINKILDEK